MMMLRFRGLARPARSAATRSLKSRKQAATLFHSRARQANSVVGAHRGGRAVSEQRLKAFPLQIRSLSGSSTQSFLRDMSEQPEDELQERWVMDEAKALSSQYYEHISSVKGSLGIGTLKNKQELHQKLKEQLHQELFTFDTTVKIYREMVSSLTDLGLAASLKPEQRMLVHWSVFCCTAAFSCFSP